MTAGRAEARTKDHGRALVAAGVLILAEQLTDVLVDVDLHGTITFTVPVDAGDAAARRAEVERIAALLGARAVSTFMHVVAEGSLSGHTARVMTRVAAGEHDAPPRPVRTLEHLAVA